MRMEPAERGQSAFMRAVLEDLQALEQMIESGLFEVGVRRMAPNKRCSWWSAGLAPAPVAVRCAGRSPTTRA